jgi:hypothetical protein
MLKIINYGYVIDKDEHFEIKINHDYVAYIAGKYALHVCRKVISLEPHIVEINFEVMTSWFPPCQNELITFEQKKMIMLRIEAALKALYKEDYFLEKENNKLIFKQKPINMREASLKNIESIRKTKEKLSRI